MRTTVVRSFFFLLLLTSPLAAAELTLESIRADLSDKDPKVRLAAAENITKLKDSEKAIPFAMESIASDPDFRVVKACLLAIEKDRPKLYKPLAMIVLDKLRDNKLKGIKALGDLRQEGGYEAIPVILAIYRSEMLGLTRDDCRDAAFAALATLNADDPDTVAVMMMAASPLAPAAAGAEVHRAIGFLKDWVVGRDERAKQIVPFVKLGLQSGGARAWWYLELAGECGPVAKDLLPLIATHKLSTNQNARTAATDAIKKIEAKLP